MKTSFHSWANRSRVASIFSLVALEERAERVVRKMCRVTYVSIIGVAITSCSTSTSTKVTHNPNYVCSNGTREGRHLALFNNTSTVQQLYKSRHTYPLLVPSTIPSKSSSKSLRICRAQQPWKVRPNAFVEKNRTRHTSWMPIFILPLLYMCDPAVAVPAVVDVDAGVEPRGMRTRREEDMRMPQLKMPGRNEANYK